MHKIVSMLIAAAMTAVVLGAAPAHAETEPTTLVVDGTLQVTAVDTFGSQAQADHLYSVVTDDGAEIPIDLEQDAPANSRFRGELVVEGAVAAALDTIDLLPRAGSTIAEDTRVGRAVVDVAERLARPLEVVSSIVAPAAAAPVTTPAPHRAYVAVLTNRGSVEETNDQVAALVNKMTGYWVTESNGVIPTFALEGSVKRFSSAVAGTTAQSCGMGSPAAVWAEAAAQFPDISFSKSSRNHLFVAMANECGAGGNIAGVAEVGNDLSSGGRMSFSMGSITTQVGVHEIGHTFGLEHANLNTCPTAGICEYYDLYSPMGLAISGGSFTPPALGTLYRSQLGVLGSGEAVTVALPAGQKAAQQTVTLTSRAAATGVRSVLVTDPVTGTRYSIDLRSHTGRDATAFYGSQSDVAAPRPKYPSGVVIERQGSTRETYLMTRPVSGREVGSFSAGTSFSPSAGLVVTVSSAGTTGSVTVRLTSRTAAAPAPAAPSLALSAKTPRVTGTARVGRTLKVKVGSWSPRPSYRYQWYANGKKIAKKSTKSSFKLTSRQKGKRITVKVTGRKAGYATVTKTSKKTKKVARKR